MDFFIVKTYDGPLIINLGVHSCNGKSNKTKQVNIKVNYFAYKKKY